MTLSDRLERIKTDIKELEEERKVLVKMLDNNPEDNKVKNAIIEIDSVLMTMRNTSEMLKRRLMNK